MAWFSSYCRSWDLFQIFPLTAWQDNGKFTTIEPDIPCIPLLSNNDYEDIASKFHTRCNKHSRISHSLISSTFSLASCSKGELRKANVLCQVDRKFVACIIHTRDSPQGTPQKTIVWIDQHAADERIRIECFLKEMCLGFLGFHGRKVETRNIRPPKSCLLTSLETSKILSSRSTRERFRSWGLDICENQVEDMSANMENTFAPIYFQGLPEIIADKVRWHCYKRIWLNIICSSCLETSFRLWFKDIWHNWIWKRRMTVPKYH